MGYLAAALTTSILMSILPWKVLKDISSSFTIRLPCLREVIKAGLVSWIPNIAMFAGQWAGVIGLHMFIGSFETGTYYIAYAITLILFSLPQSILNLMFPTLSGMLDGRKRAMYRAIKLSAAFISPIILVLMAFPWVIPHF